MDALPLQSHMLTSPNFINKVKSSIGKFTQKVTDYVRPSLPNIKKQDRIGKAIKSSNLEEKDENFYSCTNEANHQNLDNEIGMNPGDNVKQKQGDLTMEENAGKNLEEKKKTGRSYRIKYPQIIGDEKTIKEIDQQKEDRARRRNLVKDRFIHHLQSQSSFIRQSEAFLYAQQSDIMGLRANQDRKRDQVEMQRQVQEKDCKKMKRNKIILEEFADRQMQMKMKREDEDEEWKDVDNNIQKYASGALSTQINEQLSKLRQAISQINTIKKPEQNKSFQVPVVSAKQTKVNVQQSLPISAQDKSTEKLQQNVPESKTEPSKLPIPQISSNPFLVASAGLNLKDIIANKLKNPTNQSQNQPESSANNQKVLDLFGKAVSPNEKNGPMENNTKIDVNMGDSKGNSSVVAFETNMSNPTGSNGTNFNTGNGPFGFSKMAQKFTLPLNSSPVPQSPFLQHPNANSFSSQNHNQNSFPQSTPQAPQANIQAQLGFQPQPPNQFQSPQFGQMQFGFNPQPLNNPSSLSPALNMFIDSSKPTLFDEPRSRTERKPKARGYRGNKERIH